MDKYIINLDDYKKISLGEKTFKDFYLVENIKTHKMYAAKKILKELDEEEDLEEKTAQLDKIITLIKLDNPSILKTIGYCLYNFKKEPSLIIIQEYMPNGTLHQIINQRRKNKTPDGWTDTKNYINLLGIAIGMKYLHLKNIVHRDLKPLNIYLDENYYPHISEFEFSKELDSFSDLMNSGVGTLFYMAPEIMSNKSYNYKVDVYSYSILVYELITLKNPVGNCKIPSQLIQKVVDGHRPNTSMIEDQYIVEFLERCWSDNPYERPPFTEIVDMLEEKWFYSKFDVDEDEIKEYIKLFDGESLKEDILEPSSSILYKNSLKMLDSAKTTNDSNKESQDTNESNPQNTSEIKKDSNTSNPQNTSKKSPNTSKKSQNSNESNSQDSSSTSIDNSTIKVIDDSIKEVFNRPIFSLKKLKDITKSSLEDSIITLKSIKECIQKNPYEDFIPTISFQLDKPLKNINYDKLQEVLSEDAVILNVESYHTNLLNGFLSIQDYEPNAKNIPTRLQIALLSIDNCDSNVKSKLDAYVDKFLEKLNENQSFVGKIIGKPKIYIPSDEDIKSVYRRPSLNRIDLDDYDEIEMNIIRQKVFERFRNNKNENNWKFIFGHEDIYKEMNEQIRKDLETNPYEMVMVNQTIYPTILIDESKNIKIPEKQVHECFLYKGTITRENGLYGQGFYATENPFLAAMYSNGNKILGVNEETQIICCRAIYNKSKVKNLKDDSYNGKPIDDDIKNNYGINQAQYIPINKTEENIINAQEYVFPNKIQLIPICSFTIIRKDHYILWRDTNFINTSKFQMEDAVVLKKLVREKEINVYIKYDNKDALQIVENKINTPVKLITNGGEKANGKDFIEEVRRRIGSNFICLVFANNVNHLKWISKMENVLFTANQKYFWEFIRADMNLSSILGFESDLRNFHINFYGEINPYLWTINRSELLNFSEHNKPQSSCILE